jgi:uncharacterized membrane protein YdfJ with MMPL/SSD domain
VVCRRWIAGVAGLAIILALAVPALSMNTGQPSTAAFPATTAAARALQDLNRQGVPPKALPAGTYTYFCRVHPFMRGGFRVIL